MTEEQQVNDTQTTGQATGQQAETRTFTQAELDAIIKDRLVQERERQQRKLTEQYGDLNTLQERARKLDEFEAAQMSEADKLRKQIEEIQAQAAAKEREAQEATLAMLRLEVGQTKGLTPTLAKRLSGTTREELEADADVVLAELKPGKPNAPNLNATAGGADDKSGTKLTPEQRAMLERIRKVDPSMTDEKYAAALAKLG